MLNIMYYVFFSLYILNIHITYYTLYITYSTIKYVLYNVSQNRCFRGKKGAWILECDEDRSDSRSGIAEQ